MLSRIGEEEEGKIECKPDTNKSVYILKSSTYYILFSQIKWLKNIFTEKHD